MSRETCILTDTQRLEWLRLARSENVGSRTFFALTAHFGSPGDALDGAAELSRRGGRSRAIRIASLETAESEVTMGDALDARLVAWCEPDYPEALAAIDDPPPVIWIRGMAERTARPTVAVVGARNASAAGRRMARDISAGLGAADFTVVSGLARGIDTAAHEAALPTGTVAVMAGGVDVIYPPENERLYGEIAALGAVLSEHPPGTTPTARHFPPRNRLVSGLALGVVVVEAATRSGSLITARLAGEQGRDVFAVPGSPLDPRCQGTNGLIRQGAALTESADDVIAALQGMAWRPKSPEFRPESPESQPRLPDDTTLREARAGVVEMLGTTPVTVDELVRECQLSASVAMTVLLELELAGKIERHPGHRVSLVP